MERKARNRAWGSEGFTTDIHYGAYTYTIKFVPEKEIREFIKQEDEQMTVFGGVNCFEQMILVSADTTTQTKKATVLHELVHVILLRNGCELDDVEKKIDSEELVDSLALGFMELVRRNPELMRWLMA